MKIKNIIDFVLLSALWGGSYVFMRFTVGHFEAIVVAQSRLLIGAICIGLVILFRRSLWQHLQLTRSDFGTLSIISIFNSTLPFALFTYALQYLNAGVGAILNSTSPIWTAIIGSLWLHDRLSNSRKFGLLIGFLGIVFLMWGKTSFVAGGLGLPVLASIGVTISYGFATNYVKKYGQGIHPVAMSFVSLAVGACILAVPAYALYPTAPIPWSAWMGIAGLGIGSTGIAYFLYYRLMENTSPTTAISTTFLVPVFSILWGDIFLNEEPTLQMVIGGVIILFGTALAVGIFPFGSKKSKLAKT